MISEEKLYLVMSMMGDGHDSLLFSMGAYKSSVARLGVSGDLEFVEHWTSLFESEYHVRPRIKRFGGCWKCQVKRKKICEELLQYASFGTYTWKLKETLIKWLINSAPLEVIAYGSQGFYEAEGGAYKCGYTRKVAVGSVNRMGLGQIKKLLNKLDIQTRIAENKSTAKRGRHRFWELIISDRINIIKFMEKVDFTTKEKKQRLHEIVRSYKVEQKRWTEDEIKILMDNRKQPVNVLASLLKGRTKGEIGTKRWKLGIRLQRRQERRKEITKMNGEGLTVGEIAKELETSYSNVKHYLNHCIESDVAPSFLGGYHE